MIALVMLAAFASYVLISAMVVWFAVGLARKRKIKGWKLGVPAGLCMYLIVFWDYLPTVLMHKYYCATEAGFWMYQTPEEWSVDNPGVLEALTPWLRPERS